MTDHQPITETQAKTLAALLHELRPEWGVQAMVTLIGRNLQHPAPFQRLAQAAVNAALRTGSNGTYTAQTPAVIYQPGKHWDQPGVESSITLPAGPNCEDHPTFQAHNCRCCWGDIKAGLRPESSLGKRHQATETLEAPQGDSDPPCG